MKNAAKHAEQDRYDIVIIGGGASGLAAAVSVGFGAQKAGKRPAVLVIEKKEIPGKKLRATGNGRCNLSNVGCGTREEVDDFFRQVGLVTRMDEAGRMYPYSEEAGQVAELLTAQAKRLGIAFWTNSQVVAVEPQQTAKREQAEQDRLEQTSGFRLQVRRMNGCNAATQPDLLTIGCRMVLLATGGKSYSVFGTTGDGYVMARKLGHRVSRLAPALTPVLVQEELAALRGVRTKGEVRLLRDGAEVYREIGEIQFNEDCLSGICILNLSRLLTLEEGRPMTEAFGRYTITIDLAPTLSHAALAALIAARAAEMDAIGLHAKESVDDRAVELLRGIVKEKLIGYVVMQMRACAGFEIYNEDAAWEALAAAAKQLTFHVRGTKGWEAAQVTRGGISRAEIEEATMASKRIEGLYLAGEVIDYDGFCGGYNLHFAWLSGIRAGKDMAKHV